MILKSKKLLLISSLILLSSCVGNMPEPPEASKVTPIWSGGYVHSFYGRWMNSGEVINWSLPEAYERKLICTDLDSYARQEQYLREMRKLAERRCK